MIRMSPNKRKSAGATLDPVTPKKAKNTPGSAKTPENAPKSAKKGKVMGNGTPGIQKTPQITNAEAETTEIVTKTPGTGRRGKKTPQIVANGNVGIQKEESQTPKSTKKNKKNEDTTGTFQVSETPKKQKNTPKKDGASPNKGTLQKFKGTKPINANTGLKAPMTEESLMKLSKRQRKRIYKKLKKQAQAGNTPVQAQKVMSIAAKTVAEINETETTKKVAKRNRKKKNLLNKSLPVPTKEAEKSKEESKTDASSTENMEQDSDYEVETQIKPEIITKSLNETQDSDDDNQESEENDDEETPKPKNKKQKTQIELRDLTDTGIVQKGQTRYVLHVNNIPYTTTQQQVVEHFSKKCTPISVRLPTDKKTNKPKGFGYVEFKNEEDYQKGLSFHHSFLNERRINVQYTKPGEKNSDDKKKEIKQKNLKLQGMRKQGLLAGAQKDSQKRSVRRGKKKAFDKEQAEAE